MGKHDKTYVTKPFLPDLKEFLPYLEKIWENEWLTNNGEFHQQFEKELTFFLGVPYISLFTNGTLALVTALQALGIKGEVITTPYTFVATSHSLVWNNITPVFVDIDPIYGNLDPLKIEAAITKKTTAILPVHVYGNPCETDKIETISKKFNLKVIYDAAHAFDVKQRGKSILLSGDLSVLSFHATKVFNTFEGGAIVCHTPEMKHHIDNLKNFGFRGEAIIEEIGINGKMSEFNAALGMLQLKNIKAVIKSRKRVADMYYLGIKNINGIRFLKPQRNVDWNYSYFPVFIEKEYFLSRDELYNKFRHNNINVRKYFYPLINDFPCYNDLEDIKKNDLFAAKKLANEVLCLPIYTDLGFQKINSIIKLLKNR